MMKHGFPALFPAYTVCVTQAAERRTMTWHI